MEIRKAQHFLRPRAQIDSFQLGAVFSRSVKPANQLPKPRAVEIRHVAKVQQNSALAVAKQIEQKLVHRFAFNQSEPPSHIHDRNLTELPRARAKTQYSLQENIDILTQEVRSLYSAWMATHLGK
jgi:hypothetical protein